MQDHAPIPQQLHSESFPLDASNRTRSSLDCESRIESTENQRAWAIPLHHSCPLFPHGHVRFLCDEMLELKVVRNVVSVACCFILRFGTG